MKWLLAAPNWPPSIPFVVDARRRRRSRRLGFRIAYSHASPLARLRAAASCAAGGTRSSFTSRFSSSSSSRDDAGFDDDDRCGELDAPPRHARIGRQVRRMPSDRLRVIVAAAPGCSTPRCGCCARLDRDGVLPRLAVAVSVGSNVFGEQP